MSPDKADGEDTALIPTPPATSPEEEQKTRKDDRIYLVFDAVVVLIFGAVLVSCFHHSRAFALLAVAVHLVASVSGLSASIGSIAFARKPDSIHSYDCELYGAAVGAVAVMLVTLWLIYEGIMKANHPRGDIRGEEMFFFAVLAAVLHAISVAMLARHGYMFEEEDGTEMNAAYLNVLGDLIQTGLVLIAGTLTWWKPFDIGHFECDSSNLGLGFAGDAADCLHLSNWQYTDAIVTILCACVSFVTAAQILKECVDLLRKAA